MDNNIPDHPWNYSAPPVAPIQPPPSFPAGKKEGVFALCALISGMLLCNFVLFGGFNLGFAIAVIVSIGCAVVYLASSGCRFNGYSSILLGLSVLIAAGFARSDDGFVKFIMVCFLLVSVNLGLCLMAGQNSYGTSGILSLLDAPRTALVFGVGQMPPALQGLKNMTRKGGPAAKKSAAVLAGLAIALPVLCIMIPLLMSADAAFDGLVQLLPDMDIGQLIATVIFGVCAACVLFTRSVALKHRQKKPVQENVATKAISHLTVNTVLIAVAVVYVTYLLSQIAYFGGGFSGILPEEFTLAEYARRGFFEMAVLCGIDLGIIALAVGLVKKNEGKAPMMTRLLCLFIGLVTIFFVVTASSKMLLYIESFGLTRLRVLTEVIMVFLGIATLVVCFWLFLPKLPYFKVILILALLIGMAVIWVDVDTVVASYNVSAYLDGRLDSIDLDHLNQLGDGAIPQIARLVEDSDPAVAGRARTILENRDAEWEDFRDWNYATWCAGDWIDKYKLQ